MKTQKTTASPTGLHQSRTALAVILLAALLLPVPATQAATLYVSDSNAIGQSTIDRFDSTTGASLGTFVNTNSNISRGLAFDSAGNLYAAYIGTSTIEKFTSTAGALSSSGSVFASGLSTPQGLAFDSAGNLYVANTGNNTIGKFTPGGVGSVFASGGLLSNPTDLAFDSAGNLFVSNHGDNRILQFTSGGVGSVFANGTVLGPEGLAVDSAGTLYEANADANLITTGSAGTSSVFASSGLSQPLDLAFDGAGNLYAANFGNSTIEKFTSTAGVLSSTGSPLVSSGVIAPTFIAFGPASAPEPSSTLLLLGGLGAVLLRRRRK